MHGADTWGEYPARSSRGEVPCQVQQGGPCRGWVPCSGGTLPGVPCPRGVPCLREVPCPGGTLLGGTLPGGTLSRGTQIGYPQQGTSPWPGQDRGVPCQGGYPVRDNRRSTHYTVGGMPLAFTQEDFLVKN